MEGSWVDATAVAARLCRLVQHNMVVDGLNGSDLGGIDVEEEARIGGVAGDKRTLGPGGGRPRRMVGAKVRTLLLSDLAIRFGAATVGGGGLGVCIISSLVSSAPHEAALSSTPLVSIKGTALCTLVLLVSIKRELSKLFSYEHTFNRPPSSFTPSLPTSVPRVFLKLPLFYLARTKTAGTSNA